MRLASRPSRGRRPLAAVRALGAAGFLALAGCVSTSGGSNGPVASGGPQGDAITAARAGYVQMMLSNVMGTEALDGRGLDDVVVGYGGGYVLSVSASGRPNTGGEEHTAEMVLGASGVLDPMQGETYFGAASIKCYRYRIGYYSYLVSHSPGACYVPGTPGGTRASALAAVRDAATSWAAGLTAAETLFGGEVPHGTVPASLAQAEAGLAPLHGRISATGTIRPARSLTSSDFATGTDLTGGSQYGTATAALAVPLTNGVCAYVSFGYTTGNNGTREMKSSGWAAPWDATCDGRAALAASMPFSVNPRAGG